MKTCGLHRIIPGTLGYIYGPSANNATSFYNSTNVITIYPSSGSASLKFSGRFNGDYLHLTNIVADATGRIPAYAGDNSTDNGGNTNWLFQSAPLIPGGVGRNLAISLSLGMN